MLRLLLRLVCLAIALCILLMAMGNPAPLTWTLYPLPYTITLHPLFALLAALLIGACLGYMVACERTGAYRRRCRQAEEKASALESENAGLRQEGPLRLG